MRKDGRSNEDLRPIRITRGFTATPAGSVLWQQGNTIVLCTASITPDVPPWFSPKRPGGWLTADYVMLPASTPQRKDWPKTGHTDSRGTEIQRIIGRSLRAAIDLKCIGPHTIHLDCQVLQADGGTRVAAICGAYVALADAVGKLPLELPQPSPAPAANRPWNFSVEQSQPAEVPARFDPAYYKPSQAIANQIAAVSVGVIDGEVRLDLDYADDSRAEVDMNIAMTAAGTLVEVQGSAEQKGGFDRKTHDRMLDLAMAGCQRILELQTQALAQPLP